MPIFHGFGLGVGIHSFLIFGGKCVLVPTFTPESYAKLIKEKHPNFIAGVPTLFEKMIGLDIMADADMSSLEGIFCGGIRFQNPQGRNSMNSSLRIMVRQS